MPLTRIVPGALMHAADVNQLIDAWTGASGAGVPMLLSAVNDASNFALTVQNDESINQRALNVLSASGVSLLRVDATGVTLGSPLNLPNGSITTAAIADGTITSAKLAPPLDVTGYLRSRGLGAGTPSAGVGLELYYDGTEGVVQAYDRDGSAYKPLTILGTTVELRGTVVVTGSIQATVGGTPHNFVTFAGEQLFWSATGGGFRWVNQPNSMQWMALDTSGNLTLTGSLSLVNTNAQVVGDGTNLLLKTAGVVYVQTLAGAVTDLYSRNLIAGATGSLSWASAGSETVEAGEPHSKTSTVYLQPHAYVFFDLGVGHTVTCVNLVQTSDPRLKSGATVIPDADCMTRIRADVPVYSYQIAPPEGTPAPPYSTPTDIGFMADDVHASSPEFAAVDESGAAVGVSYSNMAALLWGALRSLDARCQAKGI